MKSMMYLIFPPYGLYVLLFKSKLKWYFKTAIVLFFALIFALSVDLVLSPHRVEETNVANFIRSEFDDQTWGIQRFESFRLNNRGYVLYRGIAGDALYHFVITSDEEGLKMDGVYEMYPQLGWIQTSKKSQVAPLIQLALYLSEESYGEISKTVDDHIVKTEIGDIRVQIENERKINVYDNATDKKIESIEIGNPLSNKTLKYLDRNSSEFGELKSINGYDVQNGVEQFFIETTEGSYRVDRYMNGDINLLEGVRN